MKPMKTEHIWVPDATWLEAQQLWIKTQLATIDKPELETLISRAVESMKLSYSPYSHYQVGVALLTHSQRVYQGTNIERASYSETIHGEETAIAAAILDQEIDRSGRRFIKALAVAHPSDTAPCGHCRQIMVEHADNCLVIVADEHGQVRRVTSLAILLPYSFSPTDLGIK